MAIIRTEIKIFVGDEQALKSSEFHNDDDSNNSRLSDDLKEAARKLHTNGNVDRIELVVTKESANGA